MPQLDKVTFLSQFFWLCVFYLGFYYIIYKYFLPKISRILALRKKKMSLSQQGVSSLQQENIQVGKNFETLLSTALATSRNLFHDFFNRTTGWLDTSVTRVNKTHYQNINKSYIQSLGETYLSQNVLLYHASRNRPEKYTLKVLVEKMKNLRNKSKTGLQSKKSKKTKKI